MSEDKSIAIEYIKLQWADIHHSRLQDWSAIGVIAGVLYAIANIEATEPKIFLCLLGFVSSVIGASMAWQHYQVFMDKLIVIEKMESKLGIQYPARKTLLPVQILICLLFIGIASAFAGTTLYFLSEIPGLSNTKQFSYGVGIGFFLVIFAIMIILRYRKISIPTCDYETVFCAEVNKVEECLGFLGNKPLKLIADEKWSRATFKEIDWETAKWDYFHDGEKIIKPVLLNQRDIFQFSVANEKSKQDWHYHRHVFEIYVSSSPIAVDYKKVSDTGEVQSSKVEEGVLVVPPGLLHKVTLSGTTYVFQATMAGKNLSKDKVITKNQKAS